MSLFNFAAALAGARAANGIARDPEYDFVPPREHGEHKRGMQCGQCGMKFEYGQSYGFYCGQSRCPVQHTSTC